MVHWPLNVTLHVKAIYDQHKDSSFTANYYLSEHKRALHQRLRNKCCLVLMLHQPHQNARA